jgi:hypothetical protein
MLMFRYDRRQRQLDPNCVPCGLAIILIIIGLTTLTIGCNSTLYPLGCPHYTTALGTVKNVTSVLGINRVEYRSTYTLKFDWSFCVESLEGRDRDWMNSMIAQYPLGYQSQLLIPREGYYDVDGCVSNIDDIKVKRITLDLPITGIVFMLLSGILILIITIRKWCIQVTVDDIPDTKQFSRGLPH